MKLNEHALMRIAVMICGNGDEKHGKNFPYRSSSRLTSFFTDCDLHHVHGGSTRKYWVLEVLKELNEGIGTHPDLPADDLTRVITNLLDPDYFDDTELDRDAALSDLNGILNRHSLVDFLDATGHCHLRNDGSGAISGQFPQRPRPLTSEEKLQEQRLNDFFDSASEDELTQTVLVPFFQRLGFFRVHSTGHKDKLLEYGKDLWMKYQIPTGHWIYFCAQIKKVKIDARGTSGGNVTEILNQARMAMEHAIFDPDVNRKVLLDHLFIISASEITKQARAWLADHLDTDQRRRIIFMDRGEFINHAAKIVSELPLTAAQLPSDEFPF